VSVRLPFNLAVIVLAAGASTRMGQCKALLPWGATTVLGQIVKEWSRVGADAHVVSASGREGSMALQVEIDRLGIKPTRQILNAGAASGMFSSIRAAASWPFEVAYTSFAIALGDQPQIDAVRVLTPLIHTAQRQPGVVVQPSFHGAAKHPVIVPGDMFLALANSPGPTLKEALSGLPRLHVPVAEPMLDFDLDTPADYERARRIVFGGGS
jgi:molybdenum cofactor cytidylyltransferase